jgi:hypothetical protein
VTGFGWGTRRLGVEDCGVESGGIVQGGSLRENLGGSLVIHLSRFVLKEELNNLWIDDHGVESGGIVYGGGLGENLGGSLVIHLGRLVLKGELHRLWIDDRGVESSGLDVAGLWPGIRRLGDCRPQVVSHVLGVERVLSVPRFLATGGDGFRLRYLTGPWLLYLSYSGCSVAAHLIPYYLPLLLLGQGLLLSSALP